MTVSILIVNWNSREFLRRCLATVCQTCRGLNPQVIVVDAASYDGCGEMLAADFPDVVFVQCSSNLGFGRSNNLGFERVVHEAVLLLNPDAELLPGAVELLLHELARLPKAGILGPRIQNSDGSLQTSCVRALPTPLNQCLDSELLQRVFPRMNLWGTWEAFRAVDSVEVQALSGACMLMKADTYRRLGGFSPEFFMYGEDLDLCFKAQADGLKQYYVPMANIVHHGGKSSVQQFRKFSVVLTREADFRVIAKWRGRFAGYLYRTGMAISGMFRVTCLLLCIWCGRGSARSGRRQAVWKWLAIMRWAVGIERWVFAYKAECQERVS